MPEKFAVIGRGLIGSAAARHLAEQGHDVILIGPSEPENKPEHKGVFGSHYDEGRITRSLDPWPFWSRVSRASISRYRQIEARSGVPFFSEVGVIMAGPKDAALINQVDEIAEREAIACTRYEGSALAQDFPYFDFPKDTLALYEPGNSGHVSPRALVRAQGIAAQKAGARIMGAVVHELDEVADQVRIVTDQGGVNADRVLVAAGGFSNMVLPEPLPLSVYARTVALFEVSEEEAARLHDMPSMIYLLPTGEDPYLLPPIRYPDGKFYLKLGGDTADVALPDAEATKAWFRSGGSEEVAAFLEAMIREWMPGLSILSRHHQACVTTYTEQNIPLLQPVSDRISVAVAGCGRGAKCSDELGRLGAEVVLGHDLPAWAHEAAV
ncbi:MAG: FAD-dependent oxidoreductase [Litoreibacter sp.]|nr:FAD-dependent oxidoreductase [Litoreibacter sp.]